MVWINDLKNRTKSKSQCQ